MKKCAKIIDFLITALVIFLMSATSAPANLAASRGAQPANPLITTQLSAPLASQSFKVGADPYGIAFDGTNIWMVNHRDNTVTKLRASDGALAGTYAVPGGAEAVAFGGGNIWVTNIGFDTVTKLVTVHQRA